MDWLTGLRGIGPWIARLVRTHAWRAFDHLQAAHWTRLAAAVTFSSFLALFPLITVTAAIGAALLSESRLHAVRDQITQQVPGISGQLDIDTLVANAGTVGAIGAALLAVTGVGWVGTLRDCLRAVWDRNDEGENPVLRKLKDGGILLGLGGAAVVSLGASAFAMAAVDWTARNLGVDRNGAGAVLLTAAGFCVAVAADFILLTYLLTLLPGVEPPRRAVVVAGLIGAIGFELLKVLLSGYLRGVATRSVYGAFGVPVALLLWFNLVAKLLLYCAAWTATAAAGRGEDRLAASGTPSSDARPGDHRPGDEPVGAPAHAAAAPPPPGRHGRVR